jgi:sialic acid synthase SpsE
MRINSVQQNDAISKYMNNVNAASAKNPITTKISDTVELSEGAQKFAALMKAAKESMEGTDSAEETKAADIIAKMNSNSYKVPSEDIVKGIIKGFPDHV